VTATVALSDISGGKLAGDISFRWMSGKIPPAEFDVLYVGALSTRAVMIRESTWPNIPSGWYRVEKLSIDSSRIGGVVLATFSVVFEKPLNRAW
jgi:hypothetical protein